MPQLRSSAAKKRKNNIMEKNMKKMCVQSNHFSVHKKLRQYKSTILQLKINLEFNHIYRVFFWEFPGSLVVRTAGGLITGQGTKNPQVMWQDQKKKSSFFPPPSPKQGNIFISIRDQGVVIFRKKGTVIQPITVA